MRGLSELRRYPSAVAGLIIIALIVALAVYTVFALPYKEAVRLWRGGDEVWRTWPKTAQPAWTNWFRTEKLAETVSLSTAEGEGTKTVDDSMEGLTDITIEFNFTYEAAGFPQELSLFTNSTFVSKQPLVEVTWYTPDGREIRVGDYTPRSSDAYRFESDQKLIRRLGGVAPRIGLFMDPASDPANPRPLHGDYRVRVTGLFFEEDSDMDAQLVSYGQVHGLAGTDNRRRDLTIALMWGTPVALAFGLLAAIGTTILTMFIAAMGAWLGGWVDSLIQRLTEVNMILPFLPILIMIGTFYSRSIWTILTAVVLLGIFGSSIKTFRAIFLQVRESPYIEAARAYGASSARIITRYMVPRIIPLIIPTLVVTIPSYVFLEASLAVLGLGDPVLPTWGKLINDANESGALFNGYYYWILEPAALLMLTGLGFSMVGFALDRVFNPRLRGL